MAINDKGIYRWNSIHKVYICGYLNNEYKTGYRCNIGYYTGNGTLNGYTVGMVVYYIQIFKDRDGYTKYALCTVRIEGTPTLTANTAYTMDCPFTMSPTLALEYLTYSTAIAMSSTTAVGHCRIRLNKDFSVTVYSSYTGAQNIIDSFPAICTVSN